jgi:hypothetical protein
MDNRKNNKGTIGNAGGRKPKAEQQRLVQTLEPMHPIALEALETALNDRQNWAVKLFFEYFYGKPTAHVKMESVTPKIMQITLEEFNTLKQ